MVYRYMDKLLEKKINIKPKPRIPKIPKIPKVKQKSYIDMLISYFW